MSDEHPGETYEMDVAEMIAARAGADATTAQRQLGQVD